MINIGEETIRIPSIRVCCLTVAVETFSAVIPDSIEPKLKSVSQGANSEEFQILVPPEEAKHDYESNQTKSDSKSKVYDDDDDDEYYYDPALRDMYLKQVIESDGFDVDCFPMFCGEIAKSAPPRESGVYNRLEELCCAALQVYNDQNENAKMELVEVLKFNFSVVSSILFYITFEVKDTTNSQNKIFQAKVLYAPFNKPGIEVDLCRERPATAPVERITERKCWCRSKGGSA